MDKTKIMEALETIKEVCIDNICSTCPFRNYFDECKITETAPWEWNLVKEEEEWHAFE